MIGAVDINGCVHLDDDEPTKLSTMEQMLYVRDSGNELVNGDYKETRAEKMMPVYTKIDGTMEVKRIDLCEEYDYEMKYDKCWVVVQINVDPVKNLFCMSITIISADK
eukprot:UN22703